MKIVIIQSTVQCCKIHYQSRLCLTSHLITTHHSVCIYQAGVNIGLNVQVRERVKTHVWKGDHWVCTVMLQWVKNTV